MLSDCCCLLFLPQSSGAENIFPLDTMTWGLCVPAACDGDELRTALEAHLSAAAGAGGALTARAVNVSVGHCTAPLRRRYGADLLDAVFG